MTRDTIYVMCVSVARDFDKNERLSALQYKPEMSSEATRPLTSCLK